MLKKEYFYKTNHDNWCFSPDFYLLDNNPGLSIQYKRIQSRDIKIKELFEILKEYELTLLIYDKYEIKSCNAIFDLSFKYANPDTINDIYIKYSSNFNIEDFLLKYEDLIKKVEEKKGFKMNLITISGGRPDSITTYSNKIINIDKENSYNLNVPLDDIIDDIKSDKSGLIIFNSKPGAGKSSLIKYLSQELQDKTFYFLNNNNIHILSNPEFTTFCLSTLKDCILVLEDCEKALTSRDVNKGFDISNILNITDGIMGDLLNLKIIATLNTTDKLDTALLRKGRLIRQVEFNPLSTTQVSNLSKSLGIKIDNPKEMMLCDVYNYENSGTEVKQVTKIGF